MKPTIAAGNWLRRLGLGLTLVLSLATSLATAAEPDTRTPGKLIYHNNRKLRIPFNIAASERARITEILLCVSADFGANWEVIGRSKPDAEVLTYQASQDGEYWFAVQTLDREGRLFPATVSVIEPGLRVIVDTVIPKISLSSNGRKGSLASVRWEIRDQRLDLESFVLEFQEPGARDWRQIHVPQPTQLIGEITWDANTAESIRVRAQVSDRAKNMGEYALVLPDGTPENPNLNRSMAAEAKEPPPLSSNEALGLPQFPSPTREPQPSRVSSSRTTEANGFDSQSFSASPSNSNPATEIVGIKPIPIRNARFDLKYEVEDGGPEGPATVELFVTRNGGRTWTSAGTDPDRKSPFAVDLGGDGVYGLTLVARSRSNLGDAPPVSGDRPQYLVEVDGTNPIVHLDKIQIGRGNNAGKVAIFWQATDAHLGPRPVVISYRAEGSDKSWQPITASSIDNASPYIWVVPVDAPLKFHLRIDVKDTFGNQGFEETPPNQVVVVDRSRPKSKIIGLDAATINAANPPANPFR